MVESLRILSEETTNDIEVHSSVFMPQWMCVCVWARGCMLKEYQASLVITGCQSHPVTSASGQGIYVVSKYQMTQGTAITY